jgi:CDP-glycerol glycerophosphotransferase (TagB/SpsB family)
LSADFLITDFSSLLFDASQLGIPVLRFVGDQHSYLESRGVYGNGIPAAFENVPPLAEEIRILDDLRGQNARDGIRNDPNENLTRLLLSSLEGPEPDCRASTKKMKYHPEIEAR